MIILEIPWCRRPKTLKLADRKIINVKTRQACFVFSTFLNFLFYSKSRQNPFFSRINLAMTEWQRSENKVSCSIQFRKKKYRYLVQLVIYAHTTRANTCSSHERNIYIYIHTYKLFHKYEKYFRKWFMV